ncbi:hypothetical protein HRJ34_14795 [Rhizorhabdus wittichii]|uniref:Uncharacterized protein n=1 Tax=Rhizorhabdus wittichii TaxID=160791 RepID=A0A975CZ49_9SPHN|nr:hypothetical protein [Rhizorhabdus wittichii]QTH19643.1 hypothetical protein HRJ34_14795 [Rhizorhabdus wittichii]
MAEKASKERVASDLREPNFKGAIALIRKDFEDKKSRKARIDKDIGEMWGKVEGYGVDRAAAKLFAKLEKMEEPERQSFMRSFNGLAQHADWPDVVVDLVDSAEGKVLQMRLGADARAVTGDDDEDDDDDDGEASGDAEQAAAQQAPTAIERARGHLGGGEARPH